VQTHCPLLVLHVSPEPHAAHATPPVPQDVLDSLPYGSHVPVGPPLQQPPAHVLASHEQLPLLVSHTPFEQAEHAAPPVPHALAVCDA
jgi:hypothetical protein